MLSFALGGATVFRSTLAALSFLAVGIRTVSLIVIGCSDLFVL
jgi:hypothetical protein